MCKRNSQLTGYGLYHYNEEKPKDSNYHIAMRWVEGKMNTKYLTESDQGNGIEFEPFTDEEKNNNVVEALRCCLGLNPEYKEDNISGSIINKVSRKECMPATVCPSSKFCKDLYTKLFKGELPGTNQINGADFLNNSYPENYQPIFPPPKDELTTPPTAAPTAAPTAGTAAPTPTPTPPSNDLENVSYYGKMYCELMSGGGEKDTNDPLIKDCGKDSDINILCRKAMYNYAIEPVTVKNKGPQLNDDPGEDDLLSTYKLPLRIFDQSVYKWCKQDDLIESLPNQYGVCDMLLGRGCQQLQVDGWITPDNWSDSPIIDHFMPNGTWIENEGTPNERIHDVRYSESGGSSRSKIAKTLENTCGCFLLGAECENNDCSYFYCGAGSNGERGPDKVKFGGFGESDYGSSELNYNVPETLYGSWGNLPVWDSNILRDFTCTSQGDGKSNCFSNCNYVNYYDTCWNAGSDERRGDVNRDINQWDCKSLDNNNSCETFGNGKYGCFGFCPIDYRNVPNCGTQTWFTEPQNITPNEIDYKSKKISGSTDNIPYKQYPMWQNYYTYKADQVESPVIDIRGWGKALTKNYSRICDSSSCGDNNDSIKPYGFEGKNCGTECNIRQNITINNVGDFVGGVVMNNQASEACNFGENWSDSAFVSYNEEVRNEYIKYMGSENCDPQDEECYKTSDICIDPETGDNCQICGSVDSTNGTEKINTCCTSDLLYPTNPTPEQSEEICVPFKLIDAEGDPIPNNCQNLNEQQCNDSQDCFWTTRWAADNYNIIQTLGNNVTYMCQSECSEGTTNLSDLENSLCQNPCSTHTNQTDCQNECQVCQWVQGGTIDDITVDPHCVATCIPP